MPFIGSKNTINDNSIAFILQYEHFRMLFTGDAGVAAEQRFLNEGIDLHADLLKSATTVQPTAVRRRSSSRYIPNTIETLQRVTRTFRTDENGRGERYVGRSRGAHFADDAAPMSEPFKTNTAAFSDSAPAFDG